jgi:REP element-mobilizing transposase RayT
MTSNERYPEGPGIYHVTTRGVRRQIIYRDFHDYEWFERLLSWIAADEEWFYLAYVAMPNHYHFVVETTQANLSKGMQRLNYRYAVHFNQRHDLAGHVFEHEFRSRVIESDEHLFEAVRYDVLNPVRARLCEHPGLWRWSSYRRTVGRPAPDVVSFDRIKTYFGDDAAAFARYVAEALPALVF